MRELISQKADVSSRDHQNRSPLFHASQNGDAEMVRMLNKAGALPDDGSLHEAARMAHPQIVSLLLSVGHDMNFPSLLHSDEGGLGRTPLEELCLKAARKNTDEDVTWSTRLRETIQILLHNYQGKDIKKNGGINNNKSVLHLALDNAKNPVDVTEALLEFPQVWKFINEPVHRFEDAEGFIYSPTKYVEYFYGGPKTMGKQLIRLLRGKRCQDRYYSSRGYDDQPEHAVGIPEDIVAEISKRKRLEREKKQEMARIEELAAHQRDVRMKDHQLELRMSDERHERTMKRAEEKDTYEQRTIQSRHALALVHEQALNQQRRNQLEEDNKLKLRLLSNESMQQEALLEAGRAKELQYKNRLLIQNREAEEAKMGIQKQLLWERDKTDEKQHGRQIQLLNHQDEIHGKQHNRHVSLLEHQDSSVKSRAVEARSVAEAARVANMPSNLLQLEGPD
jgi:Ankyrin repeats (3 copies)